MSETDAAPGAVDTPGWEGGVRVSGGLSAGHILGLRMDRSLNIEIDNVMRAAMCIFFKCVTAPPLHSIPPADLST